MLFGKNTLVGKLRLCYSNRKEWVLQNIRKYEKRETGMVNSLTDKITLLDGNKIPGFGFGCYNAYGEEMANAVRMAIEAGYRYIDSATFYHNEDAVGEGLSTAGVSHDELFVLSKTWPNAYSNVEGSVMENLKNLKVEYLDAMLLHWPWMDEALRLSAYEQGLKLREKGLIKTMGVSNFQIEQLEKLYEEFGEWPAINELEIHPHYQQRELVEFCKSKGIQIIAYSPIARGRYTDNAELLEIAKKYEKSTAQLILRWHTQNGIIPIPKSSHRERIIENADIFDFALSKEEMAAIDALDCNGRMGKDPYHFPTAEQM